MITWKQKLGNPECPYLIRWVFNFYFFAIRIHHWISSDDPRYFHDHPWWYFSWVIWGGYTDKNPDGETYRNRWSLKFFPAKHQHTVQVDPGGAWTIMVTGREKRIWGFWVDGKFKKRNRYFFDYKHHPCEKL